MTTLKVSMIQLMEIYRVGLTRLSGQTILSGNKKSMNNLILEAIDYYLSLPLEAQETVAIQGAWKAFTVRMPDSKKQAVLTVCGHLQVKNGLPVSMSAALNRAIDLFLKHHSIKL